MEKMCTKCGKTKPMDSFPRNRRVSSGRHSTCKACAKLYYDANKARISEHGRQYRIKHGDAIRERQRKHRQTIEGRARKSYDKAIAKARQHGRTPDMSFADVLALFKERKTCAYCDTAIGMGEGEAKITIDHIYSLCHDRGGENFIGNIEAVCLTCNLRKQDSHIYDFYQKSDLFTDELWRSFVARWIGRLINRSISEAEVDVMTARLAAEAQESRVRQ